MPENAQSRYAQMAAVLGSEYGHLAITGLRQAGQGMDARVYRADSAELGPVAIRLPHGRYVTSGNEPLLDTRRQLRQDYELSRHLCAHGLPVPEVYLLHTDDNGVDFTVAEFIEGDGSTLTDERFGRLIRAVHEIPAPELDLVCMEGHGSADDLLASRIIQRLKTLMAATDLGVEMPDIAGALAADPVDSQPRRLLHMDLRPENILTRGGRVAALLDWSNALTGDPALDLARTAEYGDLTPTVLAAYGDSGTFTMIPATCRQTVYRLDTAVMLAHVFREGAPDPERARHYTDRTRTLCRVLSG